MPPAAAKTATLSTAITAFLSVIFSSAMVYWALTGFTGKAIAEESEKLKVDIKEQTAKQTATDLTVAHLQTDIANQLGAIRAEQSATSMQLQQMNSNLDRVLNKR